MTWLILACIFFALFYLGDRRVALRLLRMLLVRR